MTKYWWTDDSNSEYRPEGWDSQPEPDLEGPDSALLKTDLMWEKTNCLAEAPYVCKSPGKSHRMSHCLLLLFTVNLSIGSKFFGKKTLY